VYVNADEIEQRFRQDGQLDLSDYQVSTNAEEVLDHFRHSQLLPEERDPNNANKIGWAGNCLRLKQIQKMSYYAAVTADLIRNELLKNLRTFSFETVMSNPDKVELLKRAQACGYRTYLYYIATDDPAINISRVRLRVAQGGHDVPEDKIRSRYVRSLDLLWNAIRYSSRAYIFDNSKDGSERTWLAEVTNGTDLEVKSDSLPAWFKKSVWDRIERKP
jgi:predicted ABC-type ATPase